ncbi:hypothetical protein NUM3379_10110 [Kineococcus sp. NUM-3379]
MDVLLVYAAARAFSAAVLDRVARFQEPAVWTGADPGFGDMLVLWDAQWYRQIAEEGYPRAVVRGPDGLPRQSALAFYPLFPLLVRAATGLTGLPFAVAGPVLALVLGAAAAVVVHRLVLEAVLASGAGAQAAGRGAWAAVVLLSVYPASPVLQVAYTESLALLLLAVFLLLLVRRCYLAAAVPALLLGLTRPVALPLTGVVLVHLAARLVRRWRAGHPVAALGRGTAVRALVLLAASVAAGVLWPLLAWRLTGERDAYLATMGTWRSRGEVVLLRPWWEIPRWVLGEVAGPVLVVAALAAYAWLLLSRRSAPLGPELRAWCLCYLAYLVLVQDPFTNLVRYLLLLFPLGALVAVGGRGVAPAPGEAPRGPAAPAGPGAVPGGGAGPAGVGGLAACTAASLLLQVVWVAWLWRFSAPSDWSP